MSFLQDETSEYRSRPNESLVLIAGNTTLYLTGNAVGSQVDGVHDHTPVAGLKRRRVVRKGVGTSGSDVEVRLARSALASYVPGFPPNPFLVTIIRNQPNGSQQLFDGEVVNTRIENNELILRCVGKSELRMARRIPGLVVMPQCGRTLYDDWCRVPRADHTFVVQVVAVDGLVVQVDTDHAQGPRYFSGGEMVWGAEKRWITVEVGTDPANVYLSIDFPFNAPLVVGENITIHPGCNKSLNTCDVKFDNRDNFRGAPFQPIRNIHVVGVNGMSVTFS